MITSLTSRIESFDENFFESADSVPVSVHLLRGIVPLFVLLRPARREKVCLYFTFFFIRKINTSYINTSYIHTYIHTYNLSSFVHTFIHTYAYIHTYKYIMLGLRYCRNLSTYATIVCFHNYAYVTIKQNCNCIRIHTYIQYHTYIHTYIHTKAMRIKSPRFQPVSDSSRR